MSERSEPTKSSGKLSLTEALKSARETRELRMGSGVIGDAGQVFSEQFPGCPAVVVADERTFDLGGKAVVAALCAAGVRSVTPFVFSDPGLYAEMRFVEQLEASLAQHDAIPIAVGSGTINDLTKLAAHRTGRSGYLCVATAASMDGYTAFGASITFEGAKQTFDCPAPRAVVADIEIIRQAPPAMTASGYADLSAKLTAGADWILADALEVEPINAPAWNIVQGGLRDSLADPAGAQCGDPRAITDLVEGLMLGGFAMQCSRTSRPASGAEHQFSHLWDMEHHVHLGEAPSHGFKVGIATLAVTRFYEQLIAHDFGKLDVEQCVEAWREPATMERHVHETFADTDFVDTAIAETRAKQVTHAELRTQLHCLKKRWPEIRQRLAAQLLSSTEIRQRLHLAGAPTEPEQIGISRERLRESFARAYCIRRRFTVLDVAMRTCTLEALLGKLFGSEGPWAIETAAARC